MIVSLGYIYIGYCAMHKMLAHIVNKSIILVRMLEINVVVGFLNDIIDDISFKPIRNTDIFITLFYEIVLLLQIINETD